MTKKDIPIDPKDLAKVSKAISNEGKRKGLTEEEYRENMNWNRSIVITYITKFCLFFGALFAILILLTITYYLYLVAQDKATFRKAMEMWGMVFLIGLFSNCTAGFFKNLFSKVFK